MSATMPGLADVRAYVDTLDAGEAIDALECLTGKLCRQIPPGISPATATVDHGECQAFLNVVNIVTFRDVLGLSPEQIPPFPPGPPRSGG